MFTGLIEHIGCVRAVRPGSGGGARLAIDLGPLAASCRLGDSVAVNGCCLTAAQINGSLVELDAVPESLRRTTLGELAPGSRVNLELALQAGGRLGGHIVQGHVDTTATVERVVESAGRNEWHFVLEDTSHAIHIVEKGSIAIDGISLTVAGCDQAAGSFHVALIPETLARTTLPEKRNGGRVNIETDVLGKYVVAAVQAQLRQSAAKPFGFDEQRLRENGY